ncbi:MULTISPECIES: S8 family peptidase [unclassified Streptomyces]|uniref:S8 family peptidase n=1 Tax=unclassified Streptomyces TaxID=2593676 RepID=UPI00081B6315|nr:MULTISPECIES: S8 family peptidase [unclassified Streptomyces]MYQ86310.1 S8 family serine peptidase [Streptomyces sp. SID4936]SCE20207.1 Serine protease, subtilisin family [Streptomyces sp. DvalAA-43]
MRKRSKQAYAVVAAAAVVLTAGMTGPASARTSGPDPASPAVAKGTGTVGKAVRTVTLITGDRVLVDSRGRVGGIQRAKGRQDIPFFTRTYDGRTYVMPRDARRLIADGTLDQRLFDITGLAEPASLKANRAGLKVIVGYRGSAAGSARAEVRSSDGTTVRRTLSALDADAVTSTADSAGSLWDALTRRRGDGSAATTSGIGRIWLDGVRKASLDRSTGQIGAPAAWARSYDGTGVKIAVVDTGIDATHPDLTGRVVAERNFSGSPDARDRVGHGTHVASIAAGTGAKDARFKGVAPGARLINAKVLDDQGNGDDSSVLAGVDWAVAQGADIINMSLGSPDTPGIDPLEAQVDKLSAEKGVLFAVAAGNNGPGRGTVASPGSADAALTVGAVDDDDLIADFSSVGPRIGDGAVKPDITAPGVNITAAAASGTPDQNPPGYVSKSGTSMATPHVAGAAAILKQENPTWTGAQIKAALTGSAKGGTHSVFQQGAGRLAVDKAIDQTVVSEPASVALGSQQWPHTDDTPVAKQVRYRNSGTTDVTLDLSLEAPTGGDEKPAPGGFFTLGAQRITVPAGGTATVDLTADTRLGGTVDGSYSVTVVASGGGRSVRTAASVEREAESYDVTFNTVGRDGAASTNWQADLKGYDGSATGRRFFPDLSSGSTTVRLPRGTYSLAADMLVDPAAPGKGIDLINNPRFSVTGPTTVTLDARTTRPVDIKVPDAAARYTRAGMMYTVSTPETFIIEGGEFGSFDHLRTAYQGPEMDDGVLAQQWSAHWQRGSNEYNVLTGGPVKELATGYSKTYKPGDMALVKAKVGSSVPGLDGALAAHGILDYGGGVDAPYTVQPAPGTRNVYLSTAGGAAWNIVAGVLGGADPSGQRDFDALYGLDEPRRYEAGKTYTETYNVGAPGPRMNANEGIVRDGDTIFGSLPLVSDGAGHFGIARYSGASTTVHRNGELLAKKDVAIDQEPFALPSEPARYTVSTTIHRDPEINRTGTRIDASWTFDSARTESPTMLPVSTVRFLPRLALDSTVPAGGKQTVPVEVQGAAAGANLKTLRVLVSYDDTTWLPVPVTVGKVTVTAPAKGKAISLKAVVTDKDDNESTVTIHNAFFGR